jgi:hypothetical protein
MKLSEALVLKAEWYHPEGYNRIVDLDVSAALNDWELTKDRSKPDMFWETLNHTKTAYPEWTFSTNDNLSWLLLLESELQKDEEALKDIQERLIEQNKLMNKIIFS